MSIVNRRRFLKTAGLAASAALLGPFGRRASAATIFTRLDVGGLSASHPLITAYIKAIKAMRALPKTNPLSWSYQAAIHGTTMSEMLPAWNTCEHGSTWFWPWHRTYLYWFERIIRKMSGEPSWVLPFWDWTSATQRKLPAMFRDPTSELYTASRNSAINDGSGELPETAVLYDDAFAYENFSDASGLLEATPHGSVHVNIGGWMGSVPTAAQDPIFYLHHANIDRLWSLWLAQGGARSDPRYDSEWQKKSFSFPDENGSFVTTKSCDVLNTLDLGYGYDAGPPDSDIFQKCFFGRPPTSYSNFIISRLPVLPIVIGGTSITTNLDSSQFRQPLQQALANPSTTLRLVLEQVTAQLPPGVLWEVYLGQSSAQQPQFSHNNPYYIGNVVLFGSGIRTETHMGSFTPATILLPIKRSLATLLLSGPNLIPLTFVPRGLLVNGQPSTPQPQSDVVIGSATIMGQAPSGVRLRAVRR